MRETGVGDQLEPHELADLIEQHGPRVVEILAAALRALPSSPQEASAVSSRPGGGTVTWTAVDRIEGFDHRWPEVHEHYPPMTVYEGEDERGRVRFCVGVPHERTETYGRERGWASVWEVVHGEPREQRAVFVDTDDFPHTGDRIALISGKDGKAKRLFAPGDEALLPPTYAGMRLAIQRDVIQGPYAKNRLGVLARDDEAEVMLNHALAHLRLRG